MFKSNNKSIGEYALRWGVLNGNATLPFRFLACFVIAMLSASSWSMGVSGDDVNVQNTAEAVTAQTGESASRVDWRTGTYKSYRAKSAQSDLSSLQPFGSQLFEGGFRGVRSDGLNPSYRVVPGDQITLRAWGAIDIDRVMPVDSQGNIFIPSIGPISVLNVTHGELDERVRQAVKTVYPENVQVYTNLQGVQPVSVYVTGFVNGPGRYAGAPTDSLLYFLDQAGGIDGSLGSYRAVKLLRNNEVIAEIDLYNFILSGQLPQIQFSDGDTLLVGKRQTSVAVYGEVHTEYLFELDDQTGSGEALLQLIKPDTSATHVLVRGDRPEGPMSSYQSLENFADFALQDGDSLYFSADQKADHIVVRLEGSYRGPSTFTLPKDARLKEFLASVPVSEMFTDVKSVSIRRLSVQQRQQASLNDALRRLEASYLGASSSTVDEAGIRVQEAELIRSFVAKASQVEPNGRLVVSRDDQIANLRLQDGDVITLPEKSDSILISGEVLVPQSVVFSPGASAKDYIEGAGGFTQHADDDYVLVVRQNGEVRPASDVDLRGGDEILILPKAPTKNLQLATSISQIVYQIAIAARVAVDI